MKAIRRPFAVLLLLAIFLSVFCSGAFADSTIFCPYCGKTIPSDSIFCKHCGRQIVVAVPELFDSDGKAAVDYGGGSRWYSVKGYPSYEDIEAIGDEERVACPENYSYLSDYKTRYIASKEGNSVYIYRNAAKTTSNPEKLDHGAKVFVLAEKDTSSFIIYKTYENKPRSGWVSTSFLSGQYNGIVSETGTKYSGKSKSVGDAEISLSGKYMPDTDAEYMILVDPVSDCVGFTLEYKIHSSQGEVMGKRNIYVYTGDSWEWVGSFPCDSAKSHHVTVNLSSPVTVYAVAAPVAKVKNGSFRVRQNILDVMIAQ